MYTVSSFARRRLARIRRTPRTLVATVLLVVVLTLPLAACSTFRTTTTGATPASASATAVAGGAASTRPAATPPTATPATPSSTPAAAPTSAEVAAIKSVIQRANQEQQQALAANSPALMQDTSSATYYNQMVQDLADLTSSGVTSIKLVNLNWGPITLQGPTSAQATTIETWDATFGTSGTLRETDTNVYTLVLQGGAWKIQADQHPNSQRLQPPSGPPGATPTPGTAPTPPPAVSVTGPGQSRNWAGYAATGGTFTAVSGTWTVPNVSIATSPAADATWVGIGGVSSTDLIQAGTEAVVQSGQVTYAAWMETLPQASQPVPLTLNAGDKVSVSITQQSTGTWQIVIKNLTSAQSYQTNVTYQSSLSSAEWVEESPAAGRRLLLPLDSFGTVSFSGATTAENGQQRTIAQAGGQPITMYSTNGQPLAQPSALGADGSSFTVTRTTVPASPVMPGTGAAPSGMLPS